MNGRASAGSLPTDYVLPRTNGWPLPPGGATIRSRDGGKRTRQMTQTRTGFLRHFISGFALGAVALVAVQVAGPSDAKTVHGAPAVVERIG